MFQNKSILIVEDDPTIRTLLQKMLERLEFSKIGVADDGSNALKDLDANRYDAILCDLVMEPMGGHEFLQTLRGSSGVRYDGAKAQTPVIFLTNSSASDDVQKAKSLGAQGYLLKPVRFDDLKARLTQVLNR